jgi:hypothetical protein
MGVLLNLSLIVYPSYQINTQLDLETHQLIEKIRQARFNTTYGHSDLNYGIHFDHDRYIVFNSLEYLETDPQNKLFELPPQIQITEINLSGSGTEIIFNSGTGETNNYGNLKIKIKDSEQERLISVNKFGNVDWEQ